MGDGINHEPEGERYVEDHDDEAESTEAMKEIDRIDVVCLDPCLPCDEIVDNSRNPSVHEAKCHETGNSCVLSGRTARTQSNMKGHNVSQHTQDFIVSYKILKDRCWLDIHTRTSHGIWKKIEDCQHCEYKFRDPHGFTTHLRCHGQAWVQSCANGGKAAQEKSCLIDHVRSVHTQRLLHRPVLADGDDI